MAAQAGEWSVGVLAMRGDAATARDWQPLIDRLNGSVGGEHFRLRPLDLAQMREAVNRGSVQFVVTNPAQFVQLNSHYHLRWLASLRAANGDRATGNIIGSVILVRRDSGITMPQALMGKTVGAIDPQAFGGYLTGYKALSDAGIRPERDFHLRFTGFPADALFLSVARTRHSGRHRPGLPAGENGSGRPDQSGGFSPAVATGRVGSLRYQHATLPQLVVRRPARPG